LRNGRGEGRCHGSGEGPTSGGADARVQSAHDLGALFRDLGLRPNKESFELGAIGGMLEAIACAVDRESARDRDRDFFDEPHLAGRELAVVVNDRPASLRDEPECAIHVSDRLARRRSGVKAVHAADHLARRSDPFADRPRHLAMRGRQVLAYESVAANGLH
jgi:hypothetical protein